VKKVSLLGCILALVLCLALDIYAAEHKKRLTFGYDFISGRLYYPEGKRTWTPTTITAETDQGEEAMALGQFSIRYSMLQQLKPINPNLFVGVEAGIGIPRTWSTSWDVDGFATIPSSGSVEDRKLGPDITPSTEYNMSYTEEYKVSISPVLAKLLYEAPNGLTIDAGLGAYFVYVESKKTTEYDYISPTGSQKDYTDTHEFCITQVKPGIEGSIGYEFNPTGPMSFSLEGRLMYVGKVVQMETREDAYTEYNSVGPSYGYDDIKKGYEIGGLCYGLGVNLTFIF
jgi:hypothetical protein